MHLSDSFIPHWRRLTVGRWGTALVKETLHNYVSEAAAENVKC
jgi:hypothetical protein